MNKLLRVFFLFSTFFSLNGCHENTCEECLVRTLIYDSTRFNDFKKERGNFLQVVDVYPSKKAISSNSTFATVYVATRTPTKDTVLIVSPRDKGTVEKGYHVLLDSLENINIGASIEIRIPTRYLAYLKNKSSFRFANPFIPDIGLYTQLKRGERITKR